MQLPITHAPIKTVFRYCKYEDCNREFKGRPMQKYCEFHMDPHNRKRAKPKPESPALKNRIFIHNFKDTTTTQFICALDGCNEKFTIKLYPRQYIYPKYCEKHRSEFQRFIFQRKYKLESHVKSN